LHVWEYGVSHVGYLDSVKKGLDMNGDELIVLEKLLSKEIGTHVSYLKGDINEIKSEIKDVKISVQGIQRTQDKRVGLVAGLVSVAVSGFVNALGYFWNK